jgi:hypothetical protein
LARSRSDIVAEFLATEPTRVQIALVTELLASTESAESARPSADTAIERRRERDRNYRRDKRKRDKQTMIARASESADSVSTARRSPVESPLVVDSQKAKKAKKDASRKGSRLGDGEEVHETARAYADEHGLRDFDNHWAEFLDYWRGIPGQRGVKADWPATWRNRVRDLLKRQAGQPRGLTSPRGGFAAVVVNDLFEGSR